MSAPDLLATIVAATERIVAVRKATQPAAVLEQLGAARSPRGAAFAAGLGRPDAVNVIAECKRRSPSRGVLKADYDPVAQARIYDGAGAVAISVLTEPTFFDGALAHLAAVRDAVAAPLLRKDFVVDEYQLLEARAHGADAVLLIAGALDDGRLAALHRAAGALGLAALVEVHDVDELDRAVSAGASLVGVNNRDLRTLQVDVAASERLAARLPRGVTAVSESGLRTPGDVARLHAMGYAAFLIGERLMTSADPGAALRDIVAAPVGARP